jgi:hypothetical protein
LLGKHLERAELVQSFTEDKAELFEMQILEGRYDIHERDWSGEDTRNSRLDPRRPHDDPRRPHDDVPPPPPRPSPAANSSRNSCS